MSSFAGKPTPEPKARSPHLQNVGGLLAEVLGMSDLIRLEVHGPAEELDKLKGPLAAYNAEWFVKVC